MMSKASLVRKPPCCHSQPNLKALIVATPSWNCWAWWSPDTNGGFSLIASAKRDRQFCSNAGFVAM